jgi:hypothetical protein
MVECASYSFNLQHNTTTIVI